MHYETELTSKNNEIQSLKDYTATLEGIILTIQDRLNKNTTELAKFIESDPKPNESIYIDPKSQILTSVIQLPEQDSIYMNRPPIMITPYKVRNQGYIDTLNPNTVTNSKSIDMTKLSPNCPTSAINTNRYNTSMAFIEEIKRLGGKYNRALCSLDNFGDISPLVDNEMVDHPKNSLNNEQFKAFVKILGDRIKDRYEDDLSQKVFGN